MKLLSLLVGRTVSRLLLRKYWLGVSGLPLIYTLRPAFLLIDLRVMFSDLELGRGDWSFSELFQSFFLISPEKNPVKLVR